MNLEEIIYCPKCGEKLIKQKILFHSFFDITTGEKTGIYHTRIFCNKYNWIKSDHYNEQFDEDNNKVFERYGF